MTIKIERCWDFNDEQSITVNEKRYNILSAVTLARDLEVKDLVIEDMYIAYGSPCDNSLRSFLEHVKMVEDADLSFPILLNQDGFVIDGRHRLSKAILNGDKTIKAKRFIKDPAACFSWV